MSSTESRKVHKGPDIHGSDCVWCPDGPCTINVKPFTLSQCEPRTWLEAYGGAGFEKCENEGIQKQHK